jgi:hypothetical protein
MQISITVCQLSQMVVGCFVNYKAYTYKQLGSACDVTYSNIGWSFAMYSVYFALFLHFFCLAYFPKKKVIANASVHIEQESNSSKPLVDYKATENDYTARRLIPFGILTILILQNIVYPMSSIAKYISWCVYALALLMWVTVRAMAGPKSTTRTQLSNTKKFQ